jgi:hypothetical protein
MTHTAFITVIKADWSDKLKPFKTDVTPGDLDGFYFLDDVHKVRVWISFKETK